LQRETNFTPEAFLVQALGFALRNKNVTCYQEIVRTVGFPATGDNVVRILVAAAIRENKVAFDDACGRVRANEEFD
jgi:hypothetical protein